jgi:hypothetical protein
MPDVINATIEEKFLPARRRPDVRFSGAAIARTCKIGAGQGRVS